MKNSLLSIYYKCLKVRDFFYIFYNKIISLIYSPPLVRDTEETLSAIVYDQFSVSRFGDGEFALMRGENLIFQPYSSKLQVRLKLIIKSNHNNLIICIPNVFESVNWCTEKSRKYWIKHLNLHRSKIYNLLDMKKEYYDTQVTRLYIDHKDKSNVEKRFELMKKLWEDRDIVIVEGVQSRLGLGNDLFIKSKSIKRILCPSQDAYSKYEEILNSVKKQDKTQLILIALGPTATVLAYDLAIIGYQAIDIGHIDIEYEWFLQKASEKCPVNNKYIGEVTNGTKVDEINDSLYNSQIHIRIT